MPDHITRVEFNETIAGVYRAIDGKVSWKHFTWIISTIIGLYIIISAAIWSEVKSMRQDIINTGNDITAITTILQQAEITK